MDNISARGNGLGYRNLGGRYGLGRRGKVVVLRRRWRGICLYSRVQLLGLYLLIVRFPAPAPSPSPPYYPPKLTCVRFEGCGKKILKTEGGVVGPQQTKPS